jgi:hypothetical protein
MAIFATLADVNYNLPLATGDNSLLCYRSQLPTSLNDLTTWETILGSLAPDTSGNINVLRDNCYQLLQVQWPYLIYWLNMLFPNYNPPLEASEFEMYSIKTMVWLWVLQFGPALLSFDDAWKHLLSALNAPQSDWYKYLAWGGVSPGYSIDGKTARSLPAALNSLHASELTLFNLFSTVCNTADCPLKAQCQQAKAASLCATA